ncbi:unnamed protein product [Auanema sp. JU1783]|nr:unnamed protein product [Auanema sp. JU1783]
MRVAIIGAGASGLPSIKSCLEEGLDVVCYEKTSEIGGLWNYRPDNPDVSSTVMETTVVNTSKEMMAYSDFPPPEDFSNFMHHSYVNKYIRMYAEKFDLLKHIVFNMSVIKAEKNTSGRWLLHLSSGSTEEFDRLIVCTGHHATPISADIKNLNIFRGKIMHAQQYRNFRGFENKKVVVQGIGNSALDIAVDIAKIAKSVTLSTRRGTWIFNRVAEGGMPYDTMFMTRYYDWIMDTIPWVVANDFMEHRLQKRMDHDIYGLRPSHRFFQQHPTVNDSLANLISAGYISVEEDIREMTEDSVILTNGKEIECDVLIQCTGYSFGFPFLPENVVSIENHKVQLYKFVFPPEHNDIAIIGLIQPIGSVAPIAEIQSRWVSRVFSGNVALPSKEEMFDDITDKRKKMERRYFKSEKHTIQVDYVKYMDEIAGLIGCKPDIWQIALKDPRFGVRLFMGPNVPYVYRMIGPNKWDGAVEAIHGVPQRVKRPLKHRECKIRRHKKRGTTDEYFRYVSLKWIWYFSICFFCGGLIAFTSFSSGTTLMMYFVTSVIYFLMMGFMFLWFDLQYDLSTIL